MNYIEIKMYYECYHQFQLIDLCASTKANHTSKEVLILKKALPHVQFLDTTALRQAAHLLSVNRSQQCSSL